MDINKPIYALLRDSVTDFKAPAVHFNDLTLSFGEFFGLVERYAGGLSALGVKQGDVVAVCLPNVPQALVSIYALNRIGAIGNIIHPLSPRARVDTLIKSTGSKILLSLAGAGSDLVPSYVVGAPIGNERPIEEIAKSVFPVPEREGSLPALYMHSSGTTGEPKTIVLTDSQINAITEGMAMHFEGEDLRGQTCLAVLPIFHGFGFATVMHSLMALGVSMRLVPSYDRIKTPAYAIATKSNVLFGVPSIFQSMLASPEFVNADKSHITQVYCGGDFMPSDLTARFNDCLAGGGSKARLCVGYGLTECVAACAANSNLRYRLGSIGQAFKNVELGIFDEDLNELDAEERGEICVSGPSVMQGYLNDTEASGKTLIRHRDGKIWLHTRDVGYRDREGYYYFLSRIKRIAKINGFTVFPSEVEDVILSTCAVTSCIVAEKVIKGIPTLLAYIIKKDDALTEEDVKRACAEKLIKWSCPRHVVFMDSFPLNANGKTDVDNLPTVE